MKQLDFIINHVFLPPKLPHEADDEDTLARMNSGLLNFVFESATRYQSELGESQGGWATAVKMLSNMCTLQGRSSLSRANLSTAITNMDSGDFIALHIASQNAGIILQHLGSEMLFQSFEASPTSAEVMGNTGKLLCSYPGPAIAVPISKARDPTFCEEFGLFAEQMDQIVLQDARPTSTKAGETVVEERDTINPRFITEMLTDILRAIGRPAEVNRFQKRIADDVLWDNAKLPWRRSPLWLVIRVALQIASKDLAEYKSFIIFLHADILEAAVKASLNSDLLFVMNAKLSRRAYKLRDRIPQFLLSKALGVTTKNHQELEGRWTEVIKFHSRAQNWSPESLELEEDTRITLHNSKQYLDGVLSRNVTNLEPIPFTTTHTTRNPITSASGNLPHRNLIDTPESERFILLADFETWVQDNLYDWTTRNLHREDACKELSGWMDDYTTTAKKAYLSNPENMSIMLLTTYELWVAIDRVAVNLYTPLAEYTPPLFGPEKLFEPLLLPRYQQMERLHRVETYLQGRRSRANLSNPSIFSDSPDSYSFAVRYFKQSSIHQQLERTILNKAQIEKRQKIEEYERKKREYDNYLSNARSQSCSGYWDYRGRYQHSYCSKCNNEQAANSMRINVYEWPLPKDDSKRMAVIFELQCPMGFSMWRDQTYKILVDICTPTKPQERSSEQPFEQLWNYSNLSSHFISQGQRLAWSSETKSFLRSHYSDCRFPTSVDSVCVDNALKYALYDKDISEWSRKRLGNFNVKEFCTFTLPDPKGAYQGLQYTVDNCSHTSNQVISNQNDCSIELSLHEYDTFGTLRAGHRLQWLSIAREIRANTLTFSDEAVNVLIMQAAWQAGPFDASKIYRESHVDLESLQFGETLLRELERMLTSIEANWLEGTSAKILINLTARLLSTNKHGDVTKGALSLLRRAREVTLGWTRQLVTKLQECEVEEDMKDLQLRVLQMAAICRATYDVDREGDHLRGVLESPDDVAVLIECATIVHDNTPVNTDNLPLAVLNLLDRDRRLSHKLEYYLRNSISQGTLGDGLNKSVQQVYPAYTYTPGSSLWESLSPPKDRWMTTKTTGDHPQTVHYNLLSGLLLINGSPVGRLPLDFVSHPTYQRLFSEKVLDVFPSSMPGMRYQTRHMISDPNPEDLIGPKPSHQVHFTMYGSELIIRTCLSAGANKYELVPHTKLLGDFPVHFVEGYMHWLDVATGDMAFRPISQPWTTRKDWHLSYSRYNFPLMHLDEKKMFDIRSPTASMISSILSPIEDSACIDITFGPNNGAVTVHLPRLKLDFFLNDKKELESRQFRGAIVDTNQDIGTMNGLINRLVLCQGPIRSIIIPYGEVNYQNHGNHIQVHIHTEGLARVQYYLYSVDERLGRLVGNGTLASHLYKIYLHAVTAHCLPDPLTSRTGTEEALDNLRSAATWSFQKLQDDEIDILRLIASLTPDRVYYPDHLQVMQSVYWKPISSVMQHDEFHEIVVKIFAHATKFHVLREEGEIEVPPYYVSKSSNKLLERAAFRNATYRKDDFGGSLLESVKDTVYVGRDLLIEPKETHVCSVAKAVESWSPNLNISEQLMVVLEGWNSIKGVTGEQTRLGYDHQWINPNLPGSWGSIYDACRQSDKNRSTYPLMFFLSALAYSGRADLQVIGTFLAFATMSQFRSLTPPQYSSYNLANKYAPDESELKGTIDSSSVRFDWSQESNLTAHSWENAEDLWRRKNSTYRENLDLQSKRFHSELMSQWPCAYPNTPSSLDYRLLKSSDAMDSIRTKFDNWYRNKKFREHISEVQRELNSARPTKPIVTVYSFQPSRVDARQRVTTIRFRDLLSRNAPIVTTGTPVTPTSTDESEILSKEIAPSKNKGSLKLILGGFKKLRKETAPSENKGSLKLMFEKFIKLRKETAPLETASLENKGGLKLLLENFKKEHSRPFEERYAHGMLNSLKALEEQALSIETLLKPPPKSTLELFSTECKFHMELIFQAIQNTLAPSQQVEELMSKAGLWPCISPVSLLQLLPTNSQTKPNTEWKRALVSYGKAITDIQRSERLLAYSGSGKESEFHSEVINQGHQEWDPVMYPDWLLIQIENNFLVRPVQNRIASEMIKPTTGENQTIQLNMGEGKSSVIVPIVSAALADGEKLVRVVVLKPLSTQMFRLLVQKLSGLTNRRIFSMPFSRAIKLDETKAAHIRELYEECKRVQGILLVQPEHILSFKLIGLERLYEGDKGLARVLLDTQHWLNEKSRDILDESDEILRHENELIYTIGEQQALENSPDRWMIVQEIFSLIKLHAAKISKEFPQGLEVEAGLEFEKGKPGSFPVTRILESKAGEKLLSQVASDIISGLLPTVSFRLFPEAIRKLALEFITDANITQEQAQPLLEYCGKDDPLRPSLLLLRGLIAENIIFFALKEKRWRVNYGLTPKRLPKTLLAVPFRAKDIPAPRAEFSHPDVAITLTCLSYYYTGLDDNQLADCFKILLHLSNPAVEYGNWIKGLGDAVPKTLEKLSGINLLDNEERTKNIFPLFRFNKSVADFYLSHVVFPKYAKEFPHKLSSSGWDIGAKKVYPTTGFSGTNDNKDLLPLSVTQYEPQEQLNTNAKVLSYLLQPENSYICAKQPDPSTERLKVDELLKMLVQQKPRIQVLLDVGAQVLELGNRDVADLWLSLTPEENAQAIVFFNDEDELTVLSRDKTTELYAVSSFSKQMDQCLVYLDEVHTRGTDLKLPTDSRAAVTLGPSLTKDRLVQACMRMRKLGRGQSVLFCAPPEIDQKIRRVTPGSSVNVSDVLHWCMMETCISNRNNVPIWAKQGISFHLRDLAYCDTRHSDSFPSSLREQEAKTLQERFGLDQLGNDALSGPTPSELTKKENELQLIREKCAWFNVESLRGSHAQEEQERELSYEAEREQQVERPEKAEPLAHYIHADVLKFINTGTISNNADGFMPIFGSLSQTSAGKHYESVWSSKLFVTKDFAKTIKTNANNNIDEFLRPVRWMISAGGGDRVVIMSPYEVNELIPRIRGSSFVNLHIYSPKVTKGMLSFLEDQKSWTIPQMSQSLSESLVNEINIFSGQLYLRDYDAYKRFCGFLGLYLKELPEEKAVKISSDGFVEPGSRQCLGMETHSPFSKTPVLFLRELVGARRKGQDYLGTHLGQILHARLLKEEDFDVAS